MVVTYKNIFFLFVCFVCFLVCCYSCFNIFNIFLEMVPMLLNSIAYHIATYMGLVKRMHNRFLVPNSKLRLLFNFSSLAV